MKREQEEECYLSPSIKLLNENTTKNVKTISQSLYVSIEKKSQKFLEKYRIK